MTGKASGCQSGPMQPRRLVVVRHAKAEQDAATDFDRALTERGRQDAAALGAWLSTSGPAPDHALVSAAPRAMQTWTALAERADWQLAPESSPPLYTAEPETALDLVREVPGAATSLVVVGHNPTMGTLAQLLDDGQGDADSGAELVTSGFPTSAAAVFEYAGDWSDISFTSATLTGFHVGRA